MKIDNKAVSEILGTILILGIAVSLFTLISVFFFPNLSEVNKANITVDIIISTIDQDNTGDFKSYVILSHLGGESISYDSEITFKGESFDKKIIIKDYMDAESKSNKKFDIGEIIQYELPSQFSDQYYTPFEPIDFSIISNEEQSILTTGTVQEKEWIDLEITMQIDDNYAFCSRTVCVNITVEYLNGAVNSITDEEIEVTNIKVKDFKPTGFDFAETSFLGPPADTTYDPDSGIWNLNLPPPGSNVTLVIPVILTEPLEPGDTVSYIAKLWDSPYTDIDPNNNIALEDINIVLGPT